MERTYWLHLIFMALLLYGRDQRQLKINTHYTAIEVSKHTQKAGAEQKLALIIFLLL